MIVFFPLQSPAQSVAQFSPDEPGVTLDAGGKLLHRNGVFFVNEDQWGMLQLLAGGTLNTKGEVNGRGVRVERSSAGRLRALGVEPAAPGIGITTLARELHPNDTRFRHDPGGWPSRIAVARAPRKQLR